MPPGRTSFTLVCAMLVLCIALSSSASASTIVYNNFGPGDAYDNGLTSSSSYGVNGSDLMTGQQVVAARFLGTGGESGRSRHSPYLSQWRRQQQFCRG